jgi:hypothetical protein
MGFAICDIDIRKSTIGLPHVTRSRFSLSFLTGAQDSGRGTPTAFHRKAQGWREERAPTLGYRRNPYHQPRRG